MVEVVWEERLNLKGDIQMFDNFNSDLTMSMNQAIQAFKDENVNMDKNTLGFILTCLRDNAKDDEVYEVLKEILKLIK